ncbi:MAG: M43 family zinc metalloprotease [Bacteroidota bacterium]
MYTRSALLICLISVAFLVFQYASSSSLGSEFDRDEMVADDLDIVSISAIESRAGDVVPEARNKFFQHPLAKQDHLNCGADHLHEQAPVELTRRQEELELEYREWARNKKSPSRSPDRGGRNFFSPVGGARGGNPPPYTLPIVFHILHNNGPENISDERVQTSLDQLNASMANVGYYDQGTGVNTQIQFCLAQRSPENEPSNGITRTVTELTEVQADSEDLALKDLARWTPTEYVNVYVVREICGLGFGCGVAGYAYLPGAHGGPLDGIVIEARWMGEDEADNSVLTHEVGHYLGLRHTFQGGCTNNDCLVDGDQVCDTPPDNSTTPVPCDGSVNTCTTDTDSGFATDQNDMFINYMDYGFFNCYSAFSQGQSDRMSFFIENTRFSLLESFGCESPCPENVVASLTGAPGGPLLAGDAVNLTSTSTGANTNRWFVDGVLQATGENFNFTFTAPGTYTITLQAASSTPELCADDEVTITVEVVCAFEADIIADIQFPTEFESVNYSTTANADDYEWTLDGDFISDASSFPLTFPGSGIYELCLTKTAGVCQLTACESIFVTNSFQPCEGQTFAQFIQLEVEEQDQIFYPFYSAIELDGADLALAGATSNAIYLAKVTAVGQPIWSRRILFESIFGTLTQQVEDFHFYIDNDGNYLFWGSYGQQLGGKNVLVKYDPVNDQLVFARSYDLPAQFALHIDQRPGSDDYFLINRQPNTILTDWQLDFFTVDGDTGEFTGTSLNQSWGLFGSRVLFARDAQWHDGRLYTISTVGTEANVETGDATTAQCFDANGQVVWSSATFFGTNNIQSLFADRIWVDEDGILSVSRIRDNATGAGLAQYFVKFDLDGNVEWQRTFIIDIDEKIVGLRRFQGGYLALVNFDAVLFPSQSSIGLIYMDDQGQVIWSRSYGDGYSLRFDNSQHLLTAGGSIFLTGGLSISSATSPADNQSFLYRLDNFGLFQDECLQIGDLPVIELDADEDWVPLPLLSSSSTVEEIDDDYELQPVTYQANNTCNSPCFEICDNGIDDDFNGETDCEDAALAQTCCCLPGPGAPDLPTDTLLCPGETLIIEVPQLDGGSFTWSTGTTDSILVIDVPGDFSLTIIDSCGRDTSVSVIVDFQPPSTPPDLGPDIVTCANGVTNFDAGPGWETILWFDFTSDQTASAFGPGNFWVQVTDSCGIVYTDTVNVTVEPATELDLGPQDSSIVCGIDSITLSAPPGYDRYEWLPLGPLDCNNCPTVRVAVPPPGDSLTIFSVGVTDEGCAAGDSIRIYTSAGGGLTTNAEFCAGTEFVLGDTIFTEAGQYILETGCSPPDTLNLVELPPITTLSETLSLCPGDSAFINGIWYVAPATVIDTFASINGCDSVFVTNLDVFPTFVSGEVFSLCSNDSLLIGGQWFQAPAVLLDTLQDVRGCDSIFSISLELLDNAVLVEEALAICNGDSIFIAGDWQTESGIYTDSLVGVLGCDSLYEVTLTVQPEPEVSFSIDPECDSDLVTVTLFTDIGEPPFDISWDLGTGGPPLSGTEQLLPPGSYRLNITDGNGCVGQQDLLVPDSPPIEYELGSTFLDCPIAGVDEIGFLLLSDITELEQIIINGSPQTLSDSIGLLPANRYEISITDIQGCSRDTVIDAEQTGNGLAVNLPALIQIDLGDSVRVNPQIFGGVGTLSYTWLPQIGLSCTDCFTPWASPVETTDYLLMVTDEEGCMVDATVRIEVDTRTNIFVPTAFSPNLDGTNDRLFPGFPPAVVQIEGFQIYDRWGGQLYSVEDVRPEDGPFWGWNGESNGQPATVGVYVWTLEVLLANGETLSLAGDVTLVR